jgi:molecular chaperone GrpE
MTQKIETPAELDAEVTSAAAPNAAPEVASKIAPEVASAPPADPERLNTQLAELTQQLAEQQEAWLRAKAETENVRRRAQEDVSKAHKFGIEKFAGELLAVKDSLEAALANAGQTPEDWRGGVELTLKQLGAAFEKSGLTEINPLGEKFDPHQQQAMGMIEADQDANTVAQVLQKGYLIAERVLRPALVMVAKGKD